MKIFDVSVPISKDLIAYPGDPQVRIERKTSIENGGSNLSRISLGSHTGTHVDPPYHFIQDGAKVDQLPLEILIGRARVVEVTAPCIDSEALKEFDFTADVRLIFKTRNSYLWSRKEFSTEFVYMTAGAALQLVDAGIKLVAIDYLSVDKFESEDFETHRVLLAAGVIIVEGLDLREVEPGDYEMICLPLRVRDGDGAPARVVLRQV
jgi:arylformamidase